MAEQLPVPKRGLPPEAFYGEYLPRLWAALTAGAVLPTWPYAVHIRLDGGKLTYALSLMDGALRIERGAAGTPLLTFASDTQSYRVAMFEIWPRVARKLTPRLGDGASRRAVIERAAARLAPEALAALPGELALELVDDAGDVAQVSVLVGSGQGPRAKVRVTDRDVLRLVEGGGSLTTLLKSKAEVAGDVGYLLRLARVVEGER